MSPFQKLLIVAIAGISLSGCTPLVQHEMTTEFPAPVRYAVGTPPASDGRARFRDIFCRLLAADPFQTGR